MSLGVGARLGHYQVTAKLGEGGMAEVCQVRDVVGDPLSVNRRSWVSVVLLLCALVGPLGSVAAGVAHAGQAGRVRRQEGRVTARPGAMLPMLELPSTSGRVVNLTAKAGDGPLVLFFYPGDRSPYPELAGCTAEACSFRDSQVAFQQLDTTVYGVNLHTTDRQREFLDREHLGFELLSDVQRVAVESLGIPLWVSDTGEFLADRVTILVDRGGRIARVFEDVEVQGHVDDVLEAVRALSH